MALLQGLKDQIIAQTNNATWQLIKSDLSQELLEVSLDGDITRFIEVLTENADSYELDAGQIATISTEPIDLDVPLIGVPFTPISYIFQAYKSTSGAMPTAWTDITLWGITTDPGYIVDSIYDFDPITGILTINDTGIFIANAHLLVDSTANNRVEAGVRLMTGATQVPTAIAKNYAARNNAQDEGDTQFSNKYFEVTTPGSQYRLQQITVGSAANLTSAVFSVEKKR